MLDSIRSAVLRGCIQLNLVRAYGVIAQVESSEYDAEKEVHRPRLWEPVLAIGHEEGELNPFDDLPKPITHGRSSSEEQSGRPDSTEKSS